MLVKTSRMLGRTKRSITERRRRLAFLPAKTFRQVLGAAKTRNSGDLVYLHVGLGQQGLGAIEPHPQHLFINRAAQTLLESNFNFPARSAKAFHDIIRLNRFLIILIDIPPTAWAVIAANLFPISPPCCAGNSREYRCCDTPARSASQRITPCGTWTQVHSEYHSRRNE